MSFLSRFWQDNHPIRFPQRAVRVFRSLLRPAKKGHKETFSQLSSPDVIPAKPVPEIVSRGLGGQGIQAFQGLLPPGARRDEGFIEFCKRVKDLTLYYQQNAGSNYTVIGKGVNIHEQTIRTYCSHRHRPFGDPDSHGRGARRLYRERIRYQKRII